MRVVHMIIYELANGIPRSGDWTAVELLYCNESKGFSDLGVFVPVVAVYSRAQVGQSFVSTCGLRRFGSGGENIPVLAGVPILPPRR